MIYKKGDKKDLLNYRGIALVNAITKLFTHILKHRIQYWADSAELIPECQAGFRAGRSCSEQIFVLTSAVQLQLRLGGRTVYGLFVDFKRAFDSIPHAQLWNKLFRQGISSRMLRIIKNIYDVAKVQVKVEGKLSEQVQVTEGVLQGESLSPLLFILYIADIELLMREKKLVGVNIDGHTDVLMLLYADDLIILAYSRIDLQRKIRALEEYCNQNGLAVNTNKTQVMIFRNAGKSKDSDQINIK